MRVSSSILGLRVLGGELPLPTEAARRRRTRLSRGELQDHHCKASGVTQAEVSEDHKRDLRMLNLIEIFLFVSLCRVH
jgi:hypothetical protein